MSASPEGHGPLGMAFAAGQYLEHIRSMRFHEIVVATELADLRDGMVRAQSLSQSSGGGPEHGDDAVFSLIERMQALAAEWEAASAELQGEREEFARCLADVRDPRHRALLAMRADGSTWAEVGDTMRYSKSQVLRLADSALVALWAAMPEPWRRAQFPDADE